jgi:hypothetical protein
MHTVGIPMHVWILLIDVVIVIAMLRAQVEMAKRTMFSTGFYYVLTYSTLRSTSIIIINSSSS